MKGSRRRESGSRDHVWVLEAFAEDQSHERWVLDGLDDGDVETHVGWVPDALTDVNEPLLQHVRARFGIELALDHYEQVVIGREQRAVAASKDAAAAAPSGTSVTTHTTIGSPSAKGPESVRLDRPVHDELRRPER